MFYRKLNAKWFQEAAAANYEWALDYLLNGELKKAVRHQEIAAEYSELALSEMGNHHNQGTPDGRQEGIGKCFLLDTTTGHPF